MSLRRLKKILIEAAVGALALVIALVSIGGYVYYTNATADAVQPVDAIIVLGGEHDGREEYGFALARQGVSENVVLSNAYWKGDAQMARYCATRDPNFAVMCVAPAPPTTRGEAKFTRDLAAEHGWTSVLVITWRYHLPRARYIFSQCFDGDTIMRPVPRVYDFSLVEWEYTYFYQTVGFVKAFLQGKC